METCSRLFSYNGYGLKLQKTPEIKAFAVPEPGSRDRGI
jgi:hypothetical protein